MTLGQPRLDVESCESTQLLVATSLREGALVVAEHQTAGRGRLGRSWEAPAGTALLFSLLLKPPPERRAPELSLVAGVAVADSLERTLGLSVQIKWPDCSPPSAQSRRSSSAETLRSPTGVVATSIPAASIAPWNP